MQRSIFISALLLSIIFWSGVPSAMTLAQTAGGGMETIQSGGRIESKQAGGRIKEEVFLENPLDSRISSIPKFFEAIINILLVFAIPFVVFFIIYAGFMYVTARGNPDDIKKAHAALLYALIGGMLILGSRILLEIITNTVTQIK